MALSENIIQYLYFIFMLVFFYSKNEALKNIIIFAEILLVTLLLLTFYGSISYFVGILLVMAALLILINRKNNLKPNIMKFSFMDFFLFILIFFFMSIFVFIMKDSVFGELNNLNLKFEVILFLLLILIITPLLEIAEDD